MRFPGALRPRSGVWCLERRDGRRWQEALKALTEGAKGSEPLMPRIVEAVRARATVGEISDVLREVWGVFRPNG